MKSMMLTTSFDSFATESVPCEYIPDESRYVHKCGSRELTRKLARPVARLYIP